MSVVLLKTYDPKNTLNLTLSFKSTLLQNRFKPSELKTSNKYTKPSLKKKLHCQNLS